MDREDNSVTEATVDMNLTVENSCNTREDKYDKEVDKNDSGDNTNDTGEVNIDIGKDENDTDEEEEVLICAEERVDSPPPPDDKTTDCGMVRPYFGETWLNQDQVKVLREIGKQISSQDFTKSGENENNKDKKENDKQINEVSTEKEPCLQAEKSEEHDEGFPSQQEQEPILDTSVEVQLENDDVKPQIWPPKFTIMDLISALVGMIFYLFDMASDWRLAVLYYLQNDLTLFYLTVAFIVTPSLVLGIISVIWSLMEHSHYQRHRQSIASRSSSQSFNTMNQDSKLHLACRVVFSLLQLGRCFRLLEYMKFVVKSWREKDPEKEENLRKQALKQKQDSAIFGLVDGFLESASQFLLQLYLSISNQITMDFLRDKRKKYRPSQRKKIRIIFATLCLSWISTAMLQTSFYRNNRKVQKKKQNVRYKGAFFYLMWRICELGPRFIILVLFAFTFKHWCVIPIFVHFSFMFVFYMRQKPELRGICCHDRKTGGYFFLLLMSYIGIFTFVNVTDGHTRKKITIYYIIFYVENIIMSLLIMFCFPSDIEGILRWKYCVFMLIPGFILHISFMEIYYYFFHPTKRPSKGGSGITKRCKGARGLTKRCQDIKFCGINLM